MKKTIISILLGLPLLILGGCHATEKGYKAAYDAAIHKRQQPPEALPVEGAIDGFQQEDEPHKETIGGKEYYIESLNLSPVDAGNELLDTYCVAVGCFSMPTNSKALVVTLIERGLPAVVARSADDKFYAVASSFHTSEEAAEFIENFQNHNPTWSYVGLHDSPLIIFSPNNRRQ